MTESRPLPEYGEYATPEEQAKAMGREYVAPVADPVSAPTAVAAEAPVAQEGYANRFFTVLFLAFGGFSLLTSAPSYLNLRSSFLLATKDFDTGVSVPKSIEGAGVWLLAANAAIYLATVLLSVWAIRTGRRSAYIPILGFIVFALTGGLIIGVFAPGFLNQLGS
jgi:hypothetical protein